MTIFRAGCDGESIVTQLDFKSIDLAAIEACLWATENDSQLELLENITTGKTVELRSTWLTSRQ